MASMSAPPRLGVVDTVLDLVFTTRTWEGNPVQDLFERLVDAFPDRSLGQLPSAVGECLLPLRLSPEHLHLALDLVVEFDLFEASEGLGRLLLAHESDARVAVTAATMAVHPGASSTFRDLAYIRAKHDAEGDPVAQQLVALALAPDVEARSRSETLAKVQRWPGRASLSEASAPIVALAPSAGSSDDLLRLALDLRRAGALVRRLPPAPTEYPKRGWLANWTPVVAKDKSEDAWWGALRHGRVIASYGRLGPRARADLLDRINTALPPTLKLRLRSGPTGELLKSPLDNVAEFFSGAFRTHEMAFLTGMTTATLRKHARGHEALEPTSLAGSHYWTFPRLVGLRVWAYLRATLRRRIDPMVAVRLVKLAEQERATPVAVRGDGEILFEFEPGWYEGAEGQVTAEVFLIETDVFDHFSLGRHTTPRLREPSTFTRVHPGVHGGTPVIAGSRIASETIGLVARRFREVGMGRRDMVSHVQSYYPDLTDEAAIMDAAKLSDKLFSVK